MASCPYCAESIADDARQCPHCKSTLPVAPAIVSVAPAAPTTTASAQTFDAIPPTLTGPATTTSSTPPSAVSSVPPSARDVARLSPLSAPTAELLSVADGQVESTMIFGGHPSWKAWFWQYVGSAILVPVVVGIVLLVLLELRRRNLRYRITMRSIDHEGGVLQRKIETLQLWRIRDIEFHQDFMDRILGIADLRVFARDVTDPKLVLHGMPGTRDVFNALKGAVDVARLGRNVIARAD